MFSEMLKTLLMTNWWRRLLHIRIMSTANRLASLGLPSELLTAVAEVTSYLHRTFCTTLTSLQMGLDINQLLELPEHLHIMQFMEIVQQLPEAVQQPVRVRDASAFASFLGDSKNSFFKKYLVLNCLNEATYLDPQHRYNGEHYVSSVSVQGVGCASSGFEFVAD